MPILNRKARSGALLSRKEVRTREFLRSREVKKREWSIPEKKVIRGRSGLEESEVERESCLLVKLEVSSDVLKCLRGRGTTFSLLHDTPFLAPASAKSLPCTPACPRIQLRNTEPHVEARLSRDDLVSMQSLLVDDGAERA